jgi:hydrogenase-4 component E
MSAIVLWLLVGLGFGAVATRRPTAAAVMVSAQTLLVGVAALAMAPGRSTGFAVAGALLLAKALMVSAIVAIVIVRSREARPLEDASGLLVRTGGALALVLAVVALVPAVGLDSAEAEAASAALVAIGLALALGRRATLFAVLALLVVENGIAVAAVSVPGGLSLIVELGIAFDLVLLVAVAAVFQRRILDAFGTTDSDVLRGMRG